MLAQRIPKTLLVTAVAFLFFGATTGMVAATGEPDLPERFGVPAPQAGDRWDYDAVFTVTGFDEIFGADEFSGVDETVMSYEFLPGEAILGGDGAWHAVHALFEQHGIGDDALWSEYLIDASTMETVAIRSRHDSTGGGPFTSHMAGLVPRSGQQTEQTDTVTTMFGPWPVWCGIASDLQGADVRLDRPVRFAGLCAVGDPGELGPDQAETPEFATTAVLEPVGVEAVAGMSAVRFHRTSGNASMTMQLDVWMAPGIPYPVRLAYKIVMEFDLGPMAPPGFPDDITISLDMMMTGFEAGQGWGGVALPASAPPPILFAPRQPWGPDDTGIDMPHRARDAWRMATEDEAGGEWLQDHPGAQAVSGEYSETTFEDRMERTWEIIIVDDDDAAKLTATAIEWTDHRAMLAGLAEAVTPTRRVDFVEFSDAGDILGAGEAPTSVPTVASVQARWQAMRPAAGAANAYGFAACPQIVFCESLWVVSGGRVDGFDTTPSFANPVDPAGGEFEETRDMLSVDEEGQTVSHETTVKKGSRQESGLLGSGPGIDVATDGPSLGPASLSRAAWAMPAPPAAAGVAAGALLAGLIYWLWPLMKSGGAVGLFSRVRRDEVLEHPVRRTIHEAVQASPGIHYQQLIRTVGKGRGTVEHHLRKLQDAGHVVAHRNAGHTCFFVRGAMDHSVMAAVPAIRTPASARVLGHIHAHPGIRSTDLAKQLGLARSTASHHVRRLREAGLIEEASGVLVPSRLAQPALAAVAA